MNVSSGTIARQKLAISERFFEKSNYWGTRACLRLLGVPLVWIATKPV